MTAHIASRGATMAVDCRILCDFGSAADPIGVDPAELQPVAT